MVYFVSPIFTTMFPFFPVIIRRPVYLHSQLSYTRSKSSDSTQETQNKSISIRITYTWRIRIEDEYHVILLSTSLPGATVTQLATAHVGKETCKFILNI